MATRGETIIGLAATAGVAVSGLIIEDAVLTMRVAAVAMVAGGVNAIVTRQVTSHAVGGTRGTGFSGTSAVVIGGL